MASNARDSGQAVEGASQLQDNEFGIILAQIDGILYRFPVTKKYILPHAKRLHAKTGIRPEILSRSVVGALSAYMAIGMFARVFCNTIGFMYPAYKSCKVLENGVPEPIKKWLTYWVVYTAFLFVDHLADFILHLIPFYNLIKVVILVWAMNPRSDGATKLYNIFIKPYAKNLQAIETRVATQMDNLRRDSDIRPFVEMHRNVQM